MTRAIPIRQTDPHALERAVQVIHAFRRDPWAFCVGHKAAEIDRDYDEYTAVVELLTQMRRTSAQIEAAFDRANALLIGIETGRLAKYGRVSASCCELPFETVYAAAIARCTMRGGFRRDDFAKTLVSVRFNLEGARNNWLLPWERDDIEKKPNTELCGRAVA